MNVQEEAYGPVAGAAIDGRRMEFSSLPFQARMRITFLNGVHEGEPAVLGSVIGLDTDEPGLRVSTPIHLEWGTGHADQIVAEASRIWASLVTACEG
jgi:hypothetical protein